ncbi:MAG: hypothetical protein LKI92_11390 [Schleiferilactobacillus harbinensis]|jgi:hypothetical protein|nr:hypothetical protein [Schleiferilactobacillus harbinensis]MCI1912760.1 hypothetical protein [Schleiferilactobacillus harbinensis]
MEMILAVELAHSPLYYYLIAALSYAGVLALLGYYCRTCVLTPDKDKKIFMLLVAIIFVCVVAQLEVGAMIMSGYEAQFNRPITITDQAIDTAWGGALGGFLVGLAGYSSRLYIHYGEHFSVVRVYCTSTCEDNKVDHILEGIWNHTHYSVDCRWLLRSNDWVFWWKPRIANSKR